MGLRRTLKHEPLKEQQKQNEYSFRVNRSILVYYELLVKRKRENVKF